MRSILVLNAKGGTGKTTLATNLAVHFALRGEAVALIDCDPQGSALDWLALRPAARVPIRGVDASEPGARVPRGTDYAIFDGPASCHGRRLSRLLQRADTALMPVVPSPLDLAAATRFLGELVEVGRVLKRKVRIGTVANRVREHSPGRWEVEEFLRSVRLPDGRRVPFIALLRNAQSYVHAAQRGLAIWEIAPSRAARDRELWVPLLSWLDSKRSLPSR